MRKFAYAAALLLGLSAMISCNKENPEEEIIGTWEISAVEVYIGGKLADKNALEDKGVENGGSFYSILFGDEYWYAGGLTYLLFHFQPTFSPDGTVEYMGLQTTYEIERNTVYVYAVDGSERNPYWTFEKGRLVLRNDYDASTSDGYRATDGTMHEWGDDVPEVKLVGLYTKIS